jgi:hypothetical protein
MMDRREFLKAIGLGAGAAGVAVLGTSETGIETQVSSLVIKPEDIFKDPTIGPVFDMNDDITGMAGQFTGLLLQEYADTNGLTKNEAIAMLQWGLRQPASVGLQLAQCVTIITFSGGGATATQISSHPVFKEMYTRYGALLSNTGPNPLGQYVSLKRRA